MKTSLLFIMVFVISSPVISQNHIFHNQNNIFLEAFGNAGGYSFNYDRVIVDDFGARVGVMFIKSGSDLVRAFPIILNHRLYLNNNYIEIGIGATIFSAPLDFGKLGKDEANGSIMTGVLGYCFQSDIGINARICFTPFYYQKEFIPFGGFSFGYSF